MAENKSGEVADRIIKGLGLNPAFDKVPSRIADSIVPTFQTNIPVKKFRMVSDFTSNDADKTISVPVGKSWNIIAISCSLDTNDSIVAGNRRIRFLIRDPIDNTLYDISALNVQVLDSIERYNFSSAFVEAREDFASIHTLPLPANFILPENFDIRIFDDAAIDIAVDDLTINMFVEEYDYNLR